MKIYVIGSLRNPEIPLIGNQLRANGFEAFDDWFGAGHEADDQWQAYENIRGRSFSEALAGHAAQHVFGFDKKHLLQADGVLLVLPAGKSGHLEFGWAARCVPGVILMAEEPARFDVMYNFASLVTTSLEDAMAFFKTALAPPAMEIGRPRCSYCDSPNHITGNGACVSNR